MNLSLFLGVRGAVCVTLKTRSFFCWCGRRIEPLLGDSDKL